MKAAAWLGFAWVASLVAPVLWLHILAYRDPHANRATQWLDNVYRGWSGEPKGEGAAYARERTLQMIIVSAVIGVLILIDVAMRTLK